MYNAITVDELVGILADVPEADLMGLQLMQSSVLPGHLFPAGLPLETYTEAMQQMMAYSSECADLAATLINAAPARPAQFPVEDFAL